MLKVEWTYPVYKPTTPARKPGQRTVAKEVDRALPIEQAYMLVADGDKRPLLIMRECELCKGTDHAMMSRTLSNEQTVLLTHWFRCVKLPPNVLTEKHPFFNLFKKGEKQKKVPHLFFADPNGDHKSALPGDQSQSQLWKVMFTYLDRCYDENAKAAIKQLRKVLGSYDKIDAQEQLIRSRIDKEIEKNGPKSKKLKKFDKDLAKVAVQREKLRAKEKDLRDLVLKAPVEPKPETANQ
ncbi:MAG: hypothetical protein ACI89X_001991 [Planctomycetota bacterium]|jgi:hypothetical protein